MEYKELLQQLIPQVVSIYGDLLVSVILYGSVARGTQTEESAMIKKAKSMSA